MHRRQPCAQRQCADAISIIVEERIRDEKKCFRAALERLEGRGKILGLPEYRRASGIFDALRLPGGQ